MRAANKFTVLTLVVTFATITATCAFAINPQPEPPGVIKKGKMLSPVARKEISSQPTPTRVLKGMTANQFNSLAPSTLLVVGGKKVPKSEIVKALDKSRAAAAARSRGESRKFAAELQKRSSQLQAQQRKAVMAGNIAVKAKFASFHAVSANNATTLASALSVPQIIEVHAQDNIIQPGSWVAIKGINFGSTHGKVNLVGSFPGGSVPLTIQQWYSDAIMVEVPTIEGAPDQTATLQVLASGDRKSTSQVQFIAEHVINSVPVPLLTVTACSQNASFHNDCNLDSWVFCHHQNLPDSVVTSGIDRFTVKTLKNGWKAVSFFPQDNSKCVLSGNAITCSWTTYHDFNFYYTLVYAEGPRGVPMQ
ncbi:MAG: hypothetical protein PHD01_11200 [Geobacteraceae bacterium]|nr:hypothetical protein [Geobacteraceae bacterium]